MVIPPIRKFGDVTRARRVRPFTSAAREVLADLALLEHLVEQPVLARVDLERLEQQVLGVQHLDAALLEDLHEGGVLDLRLAHPDHVVEQQFPGVIRRQAPMLEPGAVDDDLSQPPDFGIDTERMCPFTSQRGTGDDEREADGQRDTEEGQDEAQIAVVSDASRGPGRP